MVGDKNRGANPTQYRDPELYEAFYSSIAIPCSEDYFYGYDLVLSKSVDTYIKVIINYVYISGYVINLAATKLAVRCLTLCHNLCLFFHNSW